MLGCGGCCDNTHRYSYSGERLDALKEDFLLLDVGVVGGARKTPGSGQSDVFALYMCALLNPLIIMTGRWILYRVYVYARAYKI